MSETRYIISDAAKMIDVEPHVLRYWEEELGMEIPRNELGHRYYTDKEVRLFTMIRDLKEKGFQLKAIKMILSAVISENTDDNIISLDEIRKNHDFKEFMDEEGTHEKTQDSDVHSESQEIANVSENKDQLTSEDKVSNFKYMMDHVMMQALEKNNQILENSLVDHLSEHILKEMDYLLRMQEEREEQRYRHIDEMIRKKQRGHREAAATKAPVFETKKAKKKWFKNREF